MKSHLFSLTTAVLILLNVNLLAHESGHDHAQVWTIYDQDRVLEFITYENKQVFFFDENRKVVSHPLSALSPTEQRVVLARYHKLMTTDESNASKMLDMPLCFWAGALLFIISLVLFVWKKKSAHLSLGLIGCLLMSLSACSRDVDHNTRASSATPINDVDQVTSVYEQISKVSNHSEHNHFHPDSNRLTISDMLMISRHRASSGSSNL